MSLLYDELRLEADRIEEFLRAGRGVTSIDHRPARLEQAVTNILSDKVTELRSRADAIEKGDVDA